MKKLFLAIFVLVAIDVALFYYLANLVDNQNAFEYKITNQPIVYQYKDIVLNDVDDFVFENYFKIINSSEKNYNYYFDDENLIIKISNNEYSIKYELTEPVVIEKVIYENSQNNINTTYDEYVYEEYDCFYVDNEYLFFDLGTSLDEIRQILLANINTTYETSIDYSRLNTSQIGQYEVFYVTKNEKIKIIVEIG